MSGRISPSGNFLAYMSDESGQWEVYLTRYPSCEGRWQASTAGGQWPRWTARGDRLFFSQIDDVMEVDVSGSAEPVLRTPKRLFTRPAGQQGPAQGVAVVQNWTAEFAKKR